MSTNKRTAHNKITFTEEQHQFMRHNFSKLSNREIADHFGMRLTRVRNEMYALGLKRNEVEYMSDDQLNLILQNWKTKGDTEIAKMLNDQFPKNKRWTKKHVEKKRRYLGLKRTDLQKKKIFERNKKLGFWSMCATKMWQTRGSNPIYTIREWQQNDYRRLFIKTSKGYKPYSLWLWELHNGKRPPRTMISHINGDPLDCNLENLELITREQNAARNIRKATALPIELQRLVKIKNKLFKKLKENGKK